MSGPVLRAPARDRTVEPQRTVGTECAVTWTRWTAGRCRFALGLFAIGLLAPPPSAAQQANVITVARGNSEVISHVNSLERVLITEPDIADVVMVSAREAVINGMRPGTTTLLFWDAAGSRHSYTIQVTADAAAVERSFRSMFPGESIHATAHGNTIILSGETRNPRIAERALALAVGLEADATVLDHIVVPDRGQVLLQVRIAEVNRNVMRDLGAHFLRLDPLAPRTDDEGLIAPGGVTPPGGTFFGQNVGPDHSFSDAVNFFLFHRGSNVSAFIRALRSDGSFRSLAEPNLLTLPNQTASFLAGGEFPYPVVQASAQGGAVTIQFQEFGVRLNFTPELANSGAVRMEVEAEVSSLDFTGGLELGGYQVPVLLSRRAHTFIELEEGQTFAIAGLMDNQLSETVRKIPLLGDIPILGNLFRSSSFQRSETELLVLATPYLVRPSDEMPELPTGEVEGWNHPLDARPSPVREGGGAPPEER